MDINAGTNFYSNNKPQGINANRVYINPYFNSYHATNNNYAQQENTSMHFNPKFSTHIPPTDRRITSSVTRIFINPNFVKPVRVQGTNQSTGFTQLNVHNVQNLVEVNMETINNETKIPVSTVNKSRYSLVRHGTIIEKEKNVIEKPSKTIKISKYKSVPISDIKNNINKNNLVQLQISNARKAKILPQNRKNIQSGHPNKFINRYKFVKNKSITVTPEGNKKVDSSKTNIAITKKNYRVKIKTIRKVFKKNNIPCPLFKKFGKCIRNTHGNCEFLHDKKHITLCRKFLKGICFDNDCLLSHDITTTKMPTCYFYLKGMCTKEDCPYVHVKLNENSKMCPDFLKGYCEKGKQCISRHVTVAGITKTLSCYKYNRNEKSKIRKKSTRIDNRSTNIQNDGLIENSNSRENITEGRYYQDHGELNDISEVIKPTRCKLGSLPSFIQLRN